MEKTLKEKLAEMKAQQVELETKLAAMRQAAAALAEARNTAVANGVKVITDALEYALTEAEFPDSEVYPLTITLRQDGFQVALAKGPGAQGTRKGRGVTYQGTAYASAQALVNHLLGSGTIDKVPVSNYSAVRLLQSKGIVFTQVAA